MTDFERFQQFFDEMGIEYGEYPASGESFCAECAARHGWDAFGAVRILVVYLFFCFDANGTYLGLRNPEDQADVPRKKSPLGVGSWNSDTSD